MVHVKYTPKWAEHEKGIKAPDIKQQNIAAEAFDETRKKEMAESPKAAKWEKDRKQEWAKNKPEFVKRRIEADNAPIEQFKKDLRNGGIHDGYTLKPMPGLLILKPDEAPEQTTGGIFLPEISNALQNTGVIMAIGEDKVLNEVATIKSHSKVGDRIMYKKGAGMEIVCSWGACLLMTFDDVLCGMEKDG